MNDFQVEVTLDGSDDETEDSEVSCCLQFLSNFPNYFSMWTLCPNEEFINFWLTQVKGQGQEKILKIGKMLRSLTWAEISKNYNFGKSDDNHFHTHISMGNIYRCNKFGPDRIQIAEVMTSYI